jgi:hypothetical protein
MPANQPRVAQPDHMEAGGAGMGDGVVEAIKHT